MLKEILLVGLGGGIGSILRYLASKFAPQRIETLDFPLATFIVNITGCFLIGLFIGLSPKNLVSDNSMRLLFITGFCGGFTTFSTFAAENMQLYNAGNYFGLTLYVFASIAIGLLAVWAGMSIINSTLTH